MGRSSLYRKSDHLRLRPKEIFNSGLDPETYRTPWRRDYARLIHSPSFRRLQGKTQLFPGVESDFFRNRLTHSLEVAQIAKSIAIRINGLYNSAGELKTSKQRSSFGLAEDLVEFAGLAHDLGHPPFGHQGEEALDECMLSDGGFEGNAQTLRILTRLEKKFRVENFGFDQDVDNRVGLNLCMRSLASVLKYDREIPDNETDRKSLAKDLHHKKVTPVKGFYKCDAHIIQKIKDSVLNQPLPKNVEFKTVECTIMDIADDIAYSTYDLEDGFKAGFISPMDLLYPPVELLDEIVERVNKALIKEKVDRKITADEIVDLIRENFFSIDGSSITEGYEDADVGKFFHDFANSVVDLQYRTSKLIAKDGSIRTGFTSSIVGRFIRGTVLRYDSENPSQAKVVLEDDTRVLVEILKTFTYMSQISSPRLKIAEYRGKEIVSKIFETLTNESKKGYELLPDDVRNIYNLSKGSYKKRVICDYIASMTDRYAIEFYGRLTSENPETIFKPF